jgi:flagellar motor protein MotB
LDAQGQVVRDLPKTMAAGEWVWDGRNAQGERVLETSPFFVAPYTQRGQDAAVPLPQLAPVLKLAPADGSTVFAKSVFRFLHRPVAESWTLVLCEKESQKEIRRVSSQGALPETWVWDGKMSRDEIAPVLTAYEYRLSVHLPNGLEIISGQGLHKVEAQVYRGVGGLLNVIIPGILFDFNSTVLKSEMADKLNLASVVLADAGTAARMICEGHADEVGGVQENQMLSEQRAAMVAQCLHERFGVGTNRLSLRGFGQGRPVDNRGTEEARARNRRVEIRVLAPMPAQ